MTTVSLSKERQEGRDETKVRARHATAGKQITQIAALLGLHSDGADVGWKRPAPHTRQPRLLLAG
jgi:hypothetical protein